MSIALPFFPLFSAATSHTNTQTVRGRPTPKKEIRRFWNGLVRRLKVNKRKLLRQSKTLCSNWRKQVLESQGNTSYLEKILRTEMCKDFGNRRWLQQDDLKEGRLCALRVDEAIDCQQGEAKRCYRGFLTVAISIITIVLLLVLFGRVDVCIFVFVLCIFLSRVECSQYPIYPWYRRDKLRLTVSYGHLG